MLLTSPAVRLTALLAITASLCSCAIGPNYKRPETAKADQFKNANVPGAAVPDQWWVLFGDDALNDLERQVEVSNQNLAQAIAAYDQASAVVREQRSALFPSVSVNADVQHSGGGALNPGAGSGATLPAGSTLGTRSGKLYQAGASASWELDIWGRLRRALENARESARASAADLAAARLSAQGQLATAYLQLREADAERRLLDATVVAYQRTLTITQNRYNAGVAARTDVLQAQTQLYNAQNQEAALTLQRAQLENSIAALIGRPASTFRVAESADWNLPAPQIPAGVPSTLLERRPDIVAAEHRVAAANATIGEQQANYLPTLTLTGNINFLSTVASTLFQSAHETNSVEGQAADTILDFGAKRASVAAAKAAYRQAVAAYRQTVLTAFEDVENDLAAADILLKEYDFLRQASDAADLTEQLTLNQYKAGTVDFTTVVVAEAAALNARRSLASMRLSRQTNAVALVTALGGGWIATPPTTAAATATPTASPAPAAMATPATN